MKTVPYINGCKAYLSLKVEEFITMPREECSNRHTDLDGGGGGVDKNTAYM